MGKTCFLWNIDSLSQSGLYRVLNKEEEMVWTANYLQNLQKPKAETTGKSLLCILFDYFEPLISNRHQHILLEMVLELGW